MGTWQVNQYLLYLTAKKPVDDRSINRHVADVLRRQLGAGVATPLRVLEVGAGTGSMLARMVDWGLLAHADYTAIDANPAAVAEAPRAVAAWAARRGLACERGDGGTLALRGDGCAIAARFIEADLRELDPAGSPWDLLIANAVLDLVDIPATLPQLWRCLRPGGLYWFTINFDGETIFAPELDRALDEQIAALYHRTMDERVIDGTRCGDSRTGRRLLSHLPASGAEILAAGASDWVIHPQAGRYPDTDAAFLHYIVDTVDGALRGHAELDAGAFAAWIAERHRQIDAAELAFVAHQLDFVGRAPGA